MARPVRTLLPIPLAICLLQCASPPSTEEHVAADSTVRLTIVTMNDFHGALYEVATPEGRTYGGLPIIAGALDALRQEDPDLLLLDGGDLFQGSWPVNATKGRGAVLAYNLLGVDASCVGNHEFDYGPGSPGSDPLRGALEEAAALADFPWLTANIEQVGDGGSAAEQWLPEGFQRWTILERRGIRIGVIGLSTQQTPETTLHRHVADLRFRDVVETVRELLPEVRAAGAQVVVVVGHLTGSCRASSPQEVSADCQPNGEIGRLLAELPRGSIDVIAAGHEHALMSTRVGDTFVLSSGSQGRALSRLDLLVDGDGVVADLSVLHPHWMLVHEPVEPGCNDGTYPLAPLDVGGRRITPSAQALALVQALEAEAGSLCDEIGCSAHFLERSSRSESRVGNLVADAMLSAFGEQADIAIQNAGGLRADIPDGVLRREHLHAVMPFDNRMVLVEMTGEKLRMLLRLGSAGAHGVFQIAGGSYRYDPDSSAGDDLDGDGRIDDWERDRLCEVTVDGAPLEADRHYRVVVNDFMFTGGDGAGIAFEGAEVIEPQGELVRDALERFAESQGECLGVDTATVDPEQPRIEVGPCD